MPGVHTLHALPPEQCLLKDVSLCLSFSLNIVFRWSRIVSCDNNNSNHYIITRVCVYFVIPLRFYIFFSCCCCSQYRVRWDRNRFDSRVLRRCWFCWMHGTMQYDTFTSSTNSCLWYIYIYAPEEFDGDDMTAAAPALPATPYDW